MDETILPIDHDRGGGEILDDEIHAIMVKPLPRGVRLTAVFDRYAMDRCVGDRWLPLEWP